MYMNLLLDFVMLKRFDVVLDSRSYSQAIRNVRGFDMTIHIEY